MDKMNPCAICLDGVDKASSEEQRMPGVYTTRCGHLFHAVCIGNWLKNQPVRKCAVCQNAVKRRELIRVYMDVNAAEHEDRNQKTDLEINDLRNFLDEFIAVIEYGPDDPMSVTRLREKMKNERLNPRNFHHEIVHLEMAMSLTNNLLDRSVINFNEVMEAMIAIDRPDYTVSPILGNLDGEYQGFILPIVDFLLKRYHVQLLDTRDAGNRHFESSFNDLNNQIVGFLVAGKRDMVAIKKRNQSWIAVDATMWPKAKVELEDLKSLFRDVGGKAFVAVRGTNDTQNQE